MSSNNNIDKDFLTRLTEIIHEHIDNEMFGVSELAVKAGMSRSNLLRKVKKSTGLSASQFIRQIRLKKAMGLLKEDSSLTVSEVSFEVGFNSASYFVKCFHDHYGFPPGEVGRIPAPEQAETFEEKPKSRKIAFVSFGFLLIVILAIFWFILNRSNIGYPTIWPGPWYVISPPRSLLQ